MKTTVELPDTLYRQAKVVAAARGMSLKRFFAEALEEQLRRCSSENRTGNAGPPWMAGFGALSDLANENRRILGIIEQEFETIAPDGFP